MITRRTAIKYISSIPLIAWMQSAFGGGCTDDLKPFPTQAGSRIYTAVDADPAIAMNRLLESLGGIRSIIDQNDIVILKPNSQWWRQGMTNTDAMAGFIRQVLAIPGFDGELIIADNHQAAEPDSRGWTTEHPNGLNNYNDLIAYFNDHGHSNVTKYHWHPAGANPNPLQMDGSGDAVIESPDQGDGYIWPKDIYYTCPFGNKTILSYPVFTSSYSGTTIDLKDGAFRDGRYTGQPVKLINFSALNHHGDYAGATASIKNFMGVVDMSCGYPAPAPEGTFNTHHTGASGMFRFMAARRKSLADLPWFWDIYHSPSVFRFRYTGGVLGAFMSRIRNADLHIITAVNVGFGSRTDPRLAYRADRLIASTDPVALDYWACKNVLLDATMKMASEREDLIRLNDPSIETGPLRQFLDECRRELGGTVDSNLLQVVEA